jgi:hypothetical protein
MAEFIDALRGEFRAGVHALREQVAERQRGLEESLRQWVAAELAKLNDETEKVQDQLDRDKWQNESFSEHINRRLMSVEASFTEQLQQQVQQEHGREGSTMRHPLAEMGRVLTSVTSCGCGDDTARSRGPNSPLVLSPRSLRESSCFIESRLTILEASVKGIDNLGTTLLLEGLDSRVSSLEGLHARTSRLELCWKKMDSPRCAAPDTDQTPTHRRLDRTCSTRTGGSHGSAARGGSHGSPGASARSANSNSGSEGTHIRSNGAATTPQERARALRGGSSDCASRARARAQPMSPQAQASASEAAP